MTHDETRDELARMDEWTRIHEDTDTGRWRWKKTLRTGSVDKREDHPHPPTLDAANAAVPEGWTWLRVYKLPAELVWQAWRMAPYADVEVRDTGNPMADLYALALACRRAMEERK